MSREKQIEEIYEVLTRDCDTSCCECKFDRLDLCLPHRKAEELYNAGYRKQKWISVDERLPDSDGKYLVYTGNGLIHAMYYYATNAFGFEHWDVTHWMPLPEPPKMKGGAE